MLTSRIEMACARGCGTRLPLASAVLRSSASNHFRSAAFQAKLMGWGSQAESGFVHAKWQRGDRTRFFSCILGMFVCCRLLASNNMRGFFFEVHA